MTNLHKICTSIVVAEEILIQNIATTYGS